MTDHQDKIIQKHEQPSTDADLTPIDERLDTLEQQLAELDRAELEAGEEMSEIQELTWALIDQEITPEQLRRLEQLVVEDAEARETYVRCMQMHVDLSMFFAEKRAQESGKPFVALPLNLPVPGADQTSGA